MNDRAEPSVVIDLRTYKLKSGAGTAFGRILRNDALPMLDRFGIDVVAHGSSLDDHDLYYLLRSFPSAAERNERLRRSTAAGSGRIATEATWWR